MGIYLTNGKCYIAHSDTGAVIKVKDLKDAQDFHSIERAIAQKNKAPGKCSGYYFINTAVQSEKGSAEKVKRKYSHQRKEKPYIAKQEDVAIYVVSLLTMILSRLSIAYL